MILDEIRKSTIVGKNGDVIYSFFVVGDKNKGVLLIIQNNKMKNMVLCIRSRVMLILHMYPDNGTMSIGGRQTFNNCIKHGLYISPYSCVIIIYYDGKIVKRWNDYL